MTSTLKINTLTGVSTAGSIAVTAEGNSTTTNLQRGLAKMLLHVDQTPSTQTNNYSLNVASITDPGTGFTQANLTNNLSSADAQCGTSSHSGWQHESSYGADPSTSAYTIRHRTDGTTYTDIEFTFMVLHGDLA
tara:strand:+ start:354 stop:755 length:402 start_codon:yes stop_codon:yes gene_type:complete